MAENFTASLSSQHENPVNPCLIKFAEEPNSDEDEAVNQLNQCSEEYKLRSPVAKDPDQYSKNCILIKKCLSSSRKTRENSKKTERQEGSIFNKYSNDKVEEICEWKNESTNLKQTSKIHFTPIIKSSKHKAIDIQHYKFNSIELFSEKEKHNLNKSMLNYQTEIERIHHNQLILSLLKRKQENRELSPVKSKAKYRICLYYRKMLSFYDKVNEESKSGTTSPSRSPKKNDKGSMLKMEKFSDCLSGLNINLDISQTKSNESTDYSSKLNTSHIANLKTSSTTSKVKMKKLINDSKDNYEESFKYSRKVKCIDRSMEAYKAWKNNAKMVDNSYGFNMSSNQAIPNSPCYESDYREGIPTSIITLMGKNKSSKTLNKHVKNIQSIILKSEKKPNLYKQIDERNFFTGEKRNSLNYSFSLSNNSIPVNEFNNYNRFADDRCVNVALKYKPNKYELMKSSIQLPKIISKSLHKIRFFEREEYTKKPKWIL